ncbi:hypothetical protein REPUB_Repub16aG0080400 [Reevesia pubescens]
MSAANLLGKWTRKCGSILLDVITFLVFLFLDFLDAVLCVIYKLLDEFFEGKTTQCYCRNKGKENGECFGEEIKELSETLYGRKNVFREMRLLGFARKWENGKKRDGDYSRELVNRWSDCGCESCVSWMKKGNDQKLHVAIKKIPQVRTDEDSKEEPAENMIFLHGFLSSSSFWTETVFKNVPEPVKGQYRLFAVDLLGFGRSPKPNDSMYTLNDHVEMIEKSVISTFQLNSFHLVAHSMGCIIACGLSCKVLKVCQISHYCCTCKWISLFIANISKTPKTKFIILLRHVDYSINQSPYFPSAKDGTSTSMVLDTLAGKTLWPPLAFGKSVMSWYEHVGRCFCSLFCRNHRTWERILKLLTQRRELSFMVVDLTRHTHHSAWHSMHNVICGGAKFLDDYLEILIRSKVKVCTIHGDQDLAVPSECSNNIKMKFPEVELNIIQNVDHATVIFRRKKDFAKSLENIWASSQRCN